MRSARFFITSLFLGPIFHAGVVSAQTTNELSNVDQAIHDFAIASPVEPFVYTAFGLIAYVLICAFNIYPSKNQDAKDLVREPTGVASERVIEHNF